MTASAEALIQTSNPPYTFGHHRFQEFTSLAHDTFETFRAEYSEPQWEREVYGFETGTLIENPPFIKAVMAILRAHQWNNPIKLINVIAPGSLVEHKPRYTLTGIDLKTKDLPKPFQDAIEQATTTGVFWTQAIQLSNIILRLKGLSPSDIYRRTLSAITQSYTIPYYEIDINVQTHTPILVFPVRNILRLVNVYMHFLSGLEINSQADEEGNYSRYGHGIRVWECVTSIDTLPIIPPFGEVLRKIIIDVVSTLVDRIS